MNIPIPVIDLFAGPSGLSEGFFSLDKNKGKSFFSICLSIEKEENAYQTLLLRSFFVNFHTMMCQNYIIIFSGVQKDH